MHDEKSNTMVLTLILAALIKRSQAAYSVTPHYTQYLPFIHSLAYYRPVRGQCICTLIIHYMQRCDRANALTVPSTRTCNSSCNWRTGTLAIAHSPTYAIYIIAVRVLCRLNTRHRRHYSYWREKNAAANLSNSQETQWRQCNHHFKYTAEQISLSYSNCQHVIDDLVRLSNCNNKKNIDNAIVFHLAFMKKTSANANRLCWGQNMGRFPNSKHSFLYCFNIIRCDIKRGVLGIMTSWSGRRLLWMIRIRVIIGSWWWIWQSLDGQAWRP